MGRTITLYKRDHVWDLHFLHETMRHQMVCMHYLSKGQTIVLCKMDLVLGLRFLEETWLLTVYSRYLSKGQTIMVCRKNHVKGS